jgi:hypothetical protein
MASQETLYTDPILQIAAHRNLLVIAWSDAPTVDQMRECARAARVLARKYNGGIGLLDLILSGTPTFSTEVRDEAVKLNRDPALFRLGIADTVLVTGFVGVAVRAFLATVALLARSPVPTRVLGSLAEAEAWLLPQLVKGGEPWATGDIVKLARPIIAARQKGRAA